MRGRQGVNGRWRTRRKEQGREPEEGGKTIKMMFCHRIQSTPAVKAKINRDFLKFKNDFYLFIYLHKWKFEKKKKHPEGCLTLSGSELGSIEQWVRICAQDHQCPVQMRKGHAGRCQRPSSLHMYIVWKAYVETEMRVREREDRERER